MTGLQNGRDPRRADFDWREFAAALTLASRDDGRGLRAIADVAGVTASDLSRAMGGQMVSFPKVVALARWMGRDPLDWYLPPKIAPMKTTCCTGPNVKHSGVSRGAEGGAL